MSARSAMGGGWLGGVVVAALFLVLTLWARGPAPRHYNDTRSDLSVLRFARGDGMALLVANRSPVLVHSKPYGGWPCLHSLLQGGLYMLGAGLTGSRLGVGLLAGGLFAACVLVFVRRARPVDIATVAALALLSPVVMNFAWHGMTHVLIPAGLTAGVLLIDYNLRRGRCATVLNVAAGFVLGLTDWYVYALVPAFFLAGWAASRRRADGVSRGLVVRVSLSLAAGFTLGFVVFALLQQAAHADPRVLYTAGRLGPAKLAGRMLPTVRSMVRGTFYTLVRGGLVLGPCLLAVWLAGGRRWAAPWRALPVPARVGIQAALLAPVCFAVVFSGLVAPANHRMQCLSFVPGAVLLAAGLLPARIAPWRRAAIVAVLGLWSLYGVAGYRVVPDYFLDLQTFPRLPCPLPPGDWDLRAAGRPVSLAGVVRTINNQVFTVPGTSARAVGLHPFYAAWAEIRRHGPAIAAATEPEEVLLVFGRLPPGFNLYTDRLGHNLSTRDGLRREALRLQRKGVPFVLLVPRGAALDGMPWIAADRVRRVAVEAAPIDVVRFRVSDDVTE